MFLIVGLGNPGTEYKDTRHNIGFNVVDVLADSKHLTAASSFKTNKPLQSELLEGTLHDAEVTVIKPITFMNNSGLAVKKLADSLSLSAEHIIVIHDEITLDLGQVKISKGAGAGN